MPIKRKIVHVDIGDRWYDDRDTFSSWNSKKVYKTWIKAKYTFQWLNKSILFN